NDRMYGEGGNDSMTGGAGNDTLFGGSSVSGAADGGDVIDGGDGSDIILGDNGSVDPGTGAARSFADRQGGADTIDGGGGDDTVFGGTGGDHISGGLGRDILFGDNGDVDFTHTSDTIAGRPDVAAVTLTPGATTPAWLRTTDPTVGGDDTIAGDGGGDTIFGGGGNDRLSGDSGDTPAHGDGNGPILGDPGGALPAPPAHKHLSSPVPGPPDA